MFRLLICLLVLSGCLTISHNHLPQPEVSEIFLPEGRKNVIIKPTVQKHAEFVVAIDRLREVSLNKPLAARPDVPAITDDVPLMANNKVISEKNDAAARIRRDGF